MTIVILAVLYALLLLTLYKNPKRSLRDREREREKREGRRKEGERREGREKKNVILPKLRKKMNE